jgi:hypothetical protein
MDHRFKGRTLVQRRREWWRGIRRGNICLFVRDEETGRFLFNAKALQALRIDPVEAQKRGCPLKEVAETREKLTAG